MSARSSRVLRYGVTFATGLIVAPLLTIATTYWYETRYLPRIAADFDPGPGLWLEKRD